MKIEQLADFIAAVKALKNGEFFTFISETPMDITASAKNQGVSIIKRSKKQARTGCNYEHLKETIEARENGRGYAPKGYETVVERKIQKRITKDGKEQYYLEVADANVVSTEYIITENGVTRIATFADIMQYLKESALSKAGKAYNGFRIVKFENIKLIKQGETEIAEQ